MKKSIKRARIVALAAVSACALMAVSASAASAATAWWVNPGSVTASGTLTLKQNGANEKSCTMKEGSGGSASNVEFLGEKFGGLGIYTSSLTKWLEFTCTGSTKLEMRMEPTTTTYESGFWINAEANGVNMSSPYGEYGNVALKLPWTNGTEGKSSTIGFSNTKIGFNGGGNITATGTFTIKRTGGGVLTLTH